VKSNNVGMQKHSVVDDLPFDVLVDLLSAFDKFNSDQFTAIFVLGESRGSKIAGTKIFDLGEQSLLTASRYTAYVVIFVAAEICHAFSLRRMINFAFDN